MKKDNLRPQDWDTKNSVYSSNPVIDANNPMAASGRLKFVIRDM